MTVVNESVLEKKKKKEPYLQMKQKVILSNKWSKLHLCLFAL